MPPGENQTLKWHVEDVYTNNGGMRAFWDGVRPTMIRAMLLNSTKFGTYDTIKHGIIDNGYLQDGKACQFVSSVCAGFFMTVVTSPMDNIKTRIMS